MNLVCGDRRSPEQRESYMGEGALLCGSSGPILALHDAVVSCGAAKRDAIPLIVRAHARKGAGPRHATLEVVDMGRLEIRARGLIVAPILV